MSHETEHDEITEAEAILANLLPKSTRAERRRFLVARKGNVDNARQMLEDHLIWRAQHLEQNVPNQHNLCESTQKGQSPVSQNLSENLPSLENSECTISSVSKIDEQNRKFVSLNNGPPYAKDQTRLVHMLPFMIDLKAATVEEYSLYTAQYFDSRLDRNLEEKMTLVVDIRGGEGWANEPGVNFIKFIRCISRIMGDHFPERLQRCIIFPIPRYSLWIWGVVKNFLDPISREKMVLIAGGCDIGASVPDAILEYIEPAVSDFLENNRHALFL